jgi:tRNA (guanine37-N1)-methyltransferase
MGMKVPDVLLSGNHREIQMWRRREAIRRTFLKRPDLLDKAPLTAEDREYVEELTGKASGKNNTRGG